MKSEIETLLYRQYVDGGPKRRHKVVAGDRVAELNAGPSYSFAGKTYYIVARLVVARDRRSLWYADAQWDRFGNSAWLS